ncbi:hypothetical protein VTL71DRAFT_13927 [Oculimacula yallundae]|uniref:Heterokaryon incompatibility domain-containing protein n=1 Tax=Oculimacula yallundae TaxID=86028 RepID=A0ABR4CLR2_9HELO
MSNLTAPSLYTPLDHSTSQIRLISLEPRPARRRFGRSPLQNDEVIRCSLSLADLQDPNCQYEALSYEWGKISEISDYIEVNSKRIAVRPNLWSALYHLRLRETARFLWIDALCIDQQNEQERNHQVRQMALVYSKATQVVAWLGSPDPKVRRNPLSAIFRPVSEVQESFNFAVLLYNSIPGNRHKSPCFGAYDLWKRKGLGSHRYDKDRRWDKLRQVLERSYWGRLWIIQEIVLANRIVVQFGMSELPFDTLEHVFGVSFEDVGSPNEAPVQRLFGNTTPYKLALQRYGRHSYESEMTSIFNLSIEYFDAKCVDQRDKVFGLIGLSLICCQRAVKVDYGTSALQVCFMVVEHQLQSEFHTSHGSGRSLEFSSTVRKLFRDFSGDTFAELQLPVHDLFTISPVESNDMCARLLGRQLGKIKVLGTAKDVFGDVVRTFSLAGPQVYNMLLPEVPEVRVGDSVFALNVFHVIILRHSETRNKSTLIGMAYLSRRIFSLESQTQHFDILCLDIKSLYTFCKLCDVADMRHKWASGFSIMLIGESCEHCDTCSDVWVRWFAGKKGMLSGA